MQQKYRDNLDNLETQKSRSYERFEEHGNDFIDVIGSAIPELEDEVWVSADDLLEASDEEKKSFQEASGNRIFTSIYNLLCDAEILSAFHDSPPYEIKPSSYEEQDVIDAWEYVSGEEYETAEEQDSRELEDKNPEEVQDLYEEIRD